MAHPQLRSPKHGRKIEIPPLPPDEIARLTSEASAPEIVRVSEPKLRTARIAIRGISPLVQHRFSEKSRKVMEETQRAGTQSRSRRKRDPKDFEAQYKASMHRFPDGGYGIPASAFRKAMISACRLVSIKMTHAKMSVFIIADGLGEDGTPLVRLQGEPRIHESSVRLESGVADVRWRPMFEQWGATVTVQWDSEQFSATDIVNLMLRAGLQVGILEGRPDSPNSDGMGWGRFSVDR